LGADDKSDILHFVVVKMPLKRSTLAASDRASVKKLPSLSVRQPNVSGGTYGGTNAKPLAQSRRRLCCLSTLNTISKARLSISMIAVTESTTCFVVTC